MPVRRLRHLPVSFVGKGSPFLCRHLPAVLCLQLNGYQWQNLLFYKLYRAVYRRNNG